jgi:hypothetical protein
MDAIATTAMTMRRFALTAPLVEPGIAFFGAASSSRYALELLSPDAVATASAQTLTQTSVM